MPWPALPAHEHANGLLKQQQQQQQQGTIPCTIKIFTSPAICKRTRLEVEVSAHIAGGDDQARSALVAVEVGARTCSSGKVEMSRQL